MAKEQIDGDAFKVVASGQKFVPSARRENVLSEMAKAYQASRGTLASDPLAHTPSTISGMVEITNSSGGQLNAFEVLGISGVAITHTENASAFETRVMLTGVTPTTADHLGKFAVTAEPLADGRIGKCYVDGIFPAQVDIVTAGDRWCDVKDGDATQLQSGNTGSAQIIYAPSGTGKKWCVIRIGATQATVTGLVTGNATGKGKYTGKSFTPGSSDVDPSTDLAEADFGTLAASNDCLVLNPVELALSTTGHMVTEGTNTDQFAIYFVGELLRVNSDGTKVIAAMLFYAGC